MTPLNTSVRESWGGRHSAISVHTDDQTYISKGDPSPEGAVG